MLSLGANRSYKGVGMQPVSNDSNGADLESRLLQKKLLKKKSKFLKSSLILNMNLRELMTSLKMLKLVGNN